MERLIQPIIVLSKVVEAFAGAVGGVIGASADFFLAIPHVVRYIVYRLRGVCAGERVGVCSLHIESIFFLKKDTLPCSHIGGNL